MAYSGIIARRTDWISTSLKSLINLHLSNRPSSTYTLTISMEKAQVYWEPADHSRIPGKMQCHYRLAFDVNEIPMFYVFRTCTEFMD